MKKAMRDFFVQNIINPTNLFLNLPLNLQLESCI